METELKTLKDLTPVKTGKYELLKLNCGKDFVPIDELKVEAVKRAKCFWKMSYECSEKCEWNSAKYWLGRYEEVMEFNNLTEEDLQEEKK